MNTVCRGCKTPIEPFMSFGRQPIANHFLLPSEIEQETFFEMEVGVCDNCTLFQLIEAPDPSKNFHQDYAYLSQSSKGMQIHFREFATNVSRHWLNDKSNFVVEIGCNDGIMLRHFANAGFRHLGVEPSTNVAAIAEAAGIKTIKQFFSLATATEIATKHGPANVILAANVISHIPDLAGVASGIAALLDEDGVFIFEEPYLGDVMAKTAYDQIYSEHVFLHSVHSVINIFKAHGLELIEVAPQTTHGGSMRYTIAHAGKHAVTDSVDRQLRKENRAELWHKEALDKFKEQCISSRNNLRSLLTRLKSAGHSIVGYGAPAKSTTILNYCGIGPELLDYLSDTIPMKQGKLSPGMHIPVRPYEQFVEHYPDYAVLFAWNHHTEIMAKEETFIAKNGKWINVIPPVEIDQH